jgi:hypothetical protein
MSVAGMPGVAGEGTVEKGTHLWLAARAVGALALVAAALALMLRARRHDSVPLRHMAATAAILAMSGACFALYRSADDVLNLLGHVYKAMAYLCCTGRSTWRRCASRTSGCASRSVRWRPARCAFAA